ncbi:MAG TPA: TetR family transcriptional regulator [Terracidiphilus sp.]|nr:TetR family transcriptional regulator [Terracidiphilus sp.]
MTSPIKKSEATRARILDVALDLFRRRGFEPATMREIAAEADVSVGSAYYYFESKEDLVMAYYERAMETMTPRMEAALAGAATFEERVSAVMAVKFDYFQPNRSFLGALLRHAADPQNRLSPFSEATRHIRERDQVYFARAFADSRDIRVPEELLAHLPRMLWLYQMGLILYWIYDRSPGQRKTRLLREKSLKLLTDMLKLSRFALLKPLRSRIVELIVLAEGGQHHA